MISTPELAVNPRSLNPMDSLSEGDAIPVEQGSGFGGYIERTALHDSIVQGYAELTATTTVDVAERFGDLYLRVTATTNPTITISGNLQAGRKLTLDVRSATNGCTFVIGDITYTLAAVDGVCVFHCTTDGWARPSGFFYRIKCFFDLIVTGLASISGALTVGGNTSIGGALGVTGGATIGGGASIGGGATVSGALGVGGASDFYGKLDLHGNDLSAGSSVVSSGRSYGSWRTGYLQVDNDTTIGNHLTVDGLLRGGNTEWRHSVTLNPGETALLPRGFIGAVRNGQNLQYAIEDYWYYLPDAFDKTLVMSTGYNWRFINTGSAAATYLYFDIS